MRNIRYVHALKNVVPQILTLQGFLFGIFLGGLVVVENIFNLPGLGRGIIVAINQRDFQLLIPQTHSHRGVLRHREHACSRSFIPCSTRG